MNKKNFFFFLFLLVFLSACVQEKSSFDCAQGKKYLVSRVIDGDTIETAEGAKIRLIGINSAEKKEFCFEEAKELLEKEALGKEVLIQEQGKDQYSRILANVCVQGKSVNKKLLEEGLAHYYSFEEVLELKKIQEKAMKEKKGCLWKTGKEKYIQDNCIKLEKLEFNQNNSFSGEYAEFSNDCNYSIDLNKFYLKDEATHLYFFPAVELKENSFVRVYSGKGSSTGNELFWGQGSVWNNDKDQLFLRNKKGILVVYYSYSSETN